MDLTDEYSLFHLYETVESGSEMSSLSNFCDSNTQPEYTFEKHDRYRSNKNETHENEQPISVNISIVDKWQVPDQSKLKNIVFIQDSEDLVVNPDL